MGISTSGGGLLIVRYVPNIKTTATAWRGIPAGPNPAPAAGGVEPYARHDDEHMAAFGVHCQPLAKARSPPMQVGRTGRVGFVVQ